MLTRLSLVFSLLPLIFAKGTGCAACDSLQSRWNPDANKGSCLDHHKDPATFIINFQQCICGIQGQNDYQRCTECNLDPDGGVPIDGLNFGPLSIFQSQCSLFNDDINTILKPHGFVAFARSIRPASVITKYSISEQDILAIEILSAITVTVTGAPQATKAATTPTSKVGVKSISQSGRIPPIFNLFTIVAVAVLAVIW